MDTAMDTAMDDASNHGPLFDDLPRTEFFPESGREEYQVPGADDLQRREAVEIGPTSAALRDTSDPAAQVKYNCGDCAGEQQFARGDNMRCSLCGGRVFYKQRTKRMIQFEAR